MSSHCPRMIENAARDLLGKKWSQEAGFWEAPVEQMYTRSFAPATKVDSSPMLNAKPIEPACIYPCIQPPQLVTILILDLDKEMVAAAASAEQQIGKLTFAMT